MHSDHGVTLNTPGKTEHSIRDREATQYSTNPFRRKLVSSFIVYGVTGPQECTESGISPKTRSHPVLIDKTLLCGLLGSCPECEGGASLAVRGSRGLPSPPSVGVHICSPPFPLTTSLPDLVLAGSLFGELFGTRITKFVSASGAPQTAFAQTCSYVWL